MFLCKGPVHLRLGQSGSAGSSGSAGGAGRSGSAAQGSGRSGSAVRGSGGAGSTVQTSGRGFGTAPVLRGSASSAVKSEGEPVAGPSWAPTGDYPINIGGRVLAVVTMESDDEPEGEEMSLGLLPSGECMDINPQLRAEDREILVERGRGSNELKTIIRRRQGKSNVATGQTARGPTKVLPIPDYADYVKDDEISLDDVSDEDLVDNTNLGLGDAVPTNEFSAAVARATEVSTAETGGVLPVSEAYAARAAMFNAAAAAERAAAEAARKAAQVTEGESIMQKYDDDDDEWMEG